MLNLQYGFPIVDLGMGIWEFLIYNANVFQIFMSNLMWLQVWCATAN